MQDPKTMKMSNDGAAFLAHLEGIVPGPYMDSVGVWTYGIGHTAAAGDPDPSGMERGADLDDLPKIIEIFKADLIKYEVAVANAIDVPLEQHEFDAAVSFHYNTGSIASATWVKTLNTGDREKAAEQIMNWTKPPEIIPRRTAEQDLFKWSAYPKHDITVWGVDHLGAVKWQPLTQFSAAKFAAEYGNEPVDPDELESWPEYLEKRIAAVERDLEARLAEAERDIAETETFLAAVESKLDAIGDLLSD